MGGGSVKKIGRTGPATAIPREIMLYGPGMGPSASTSTAMYSSGRSDMADSVDAAPSHRSTGGGLGLLRQVLVAHGAQRHLRAVPHHAPEVPANRTGLAQHSAGGLGDVRLDFPGVEFDPPIGEDPGPVRLAVAFAGDLLTRVQHSHVDQ